MPGFCVVGGATDPVSLSDPPATSARHCFPTSENRTENTPADTFILLTNLSDHVWAPPPPRPVNAELRSCKYLLKLIMEGEVYREEFSCDDDEEEEEDDKLVAGMPAHWIHGSRVREAILCQIRCFFTHCVNGP